MRSDQRTATLGDDPAARPAADACPVIVHGFDEVSTILAAALEGRAPFPRPTDGRDHPSAALSVAYQVMVELQTGRVVGVEALARLRDDRHRAISPDVFIPVAEHTGLIGALGRRVLHTACSDLAGWRTLSRSAAHVGVSVNVSAHQADTGDLVGDVQHALHRTGLPAHALTVELTETVMLQADHPAVAALHRLRALGVRVAIDDFGTGYAALTHLARLPVTQVKIDRSFTAGLPTDPVSTAIMRAVLALTDELGLDCVVEGIESDTQHQALTHGLPPSDTRADGERDPGPHPTRGLGSLVGQGYLLGRPTPAHCIADLLGPVGRLPRSGVVPAT